MSAMAVASDTHDTHAARGTIRQLKEQRRRRRWSLGDGVDLPNRRLN